MRRFFLSYWILWLATAVSAPVAADTAEQLFAELSIRPEAGRCIDVQVDLEASPGFSVDAAGEGFELRYRATLNNVAEGWSWQPGADPQVEDYYRFKYLPLQSTFEERGQYHAEDKIGVDQIMRVDWRYDYFLAFDNLYDFFPRTRDDDAGFVLPLRDKPAGEPIMLARLCTRQPVTSESTTFWKATYSRPVDFTLKKRYLIGTLEALSFHDRDTRKELGMITRRTP